MSNPKFSLNDEKAKREEDEEGEENEEGEEGEEEEEEEEGEEEEEEEPEIQYTSEVETTTTKSHSFQQTRSVPSSWPSHKERQPTRTFPELLPPKTKEERLLRKTNEQLRQDIAKKLLRAYGTTERGLKQNAFKFTQDAFLTCEILRETTEKLSDQTNQLTLPFGF